MKEYKKINFHIKEIKKAYKKKSINHAYYIMINHAFMHSYKRNKIHPFIISKFYNNSFKTQSEKNPQLYNN